MERGMAIQPEPATTDKKEARRDNRVRDYRGEVIGPGRKKDIDGMGESLSQSPASLRELC
jgi:hypothetical protein